MLTAAAVAEFMGANAVPSAAAVVDWKNERRFIR
jgi:hypothetical protein